MWRNKTNIWLQSESPLLVHVHYKHYYINNIDKEKTEIATLKGVMRDYKTVFTFFLKKTHSKYDKFHFIWIIFFRLYKERISQIEQKLIELKAGKAPEYLNPLAELQENMRISTEVAGLYVVTLSILVVLKISDYSHSSPSFS